MSSLNLTIYQILMLGIGSILLGYLIFLLLLFLLPRRLKTENKQQKEAALKKAMGQKEKIIKESSARSEYKLRLDHDRLESDITNTKSDLLAQEEEALQLEETIKQTQTRIDRQDKDLQQKTQKLSSAQTKHAGAQSRLENKKIQLTEKLEAISEEKAHALKEKLVKDLVESRKLESQKTLKSLQENLNTHIGKMAQRVHSTVAARYSPEFIWPKSSSVIEVSDPKTIEALSKEGDLLDELRELTEHVQIDIATDKNENPIGVKFVGGYGIFKESAKMTLEECLRKSSSNWGKVNSAYHRHRNNLEQEAYKLGQKAMIQLQLKGVHDEILTMIGALNWRTSYRQNQFLHSLEVATLAGIIAQELKLDPDIAKRCGILHDIGKGIDYRIEGSHAVISSDYADRFGENRLVCDTVMSHHNDLLLETPMSYVLKSADTLSGARPGARVNLEEGYQIRLSAIDQAVRSFPGIMKVAIMSGGREVHIEVDHKKVNEKEIEKLAGAIAKKIEDTVAYPGQIKVLLSRRFEASAVA